MLSIIDSRDENVCLVHAEYLFQSKTVSVQFRKKSKQSKSEQRAVSL